MEIESCVPPGFRFHPTDEELVGYYLRRKVNSLNIDLDVIADIDLYRMEPWDIQERCRLGYEEENERYFFSHKDKKYPTGTRTNRATAAGFWKATGRDKAVFSKNRLIGMRKTLVFYKGRAPNGTKTPWIMHEYRLQTSQHAPTQEEGWVVCRAFKKPSPNHKPSYGAWNHAYYLRDNNVNFGGFPSTSEAAVPKQMNFPDAVSVFCRPPPPPFDSSDQDLDHEFPGLQESPATLSTSLATKCGGGINRDWKDERSDQGGEYVDWQEFDNLLAAELAEPAAAFPHSNFPLVSQENETNIAQSHANYPFTCFPEF